MGSIYAENCRLFWKFKCKESYTIAEILVQFTHVPDQTPRLPPDCRILPFWWPSASYTGSVITVSDKAVSGNVRKHEGLFSRILHFWRSRLSREHSRDLLQPFWQPDRISEATPCSFMLKTQFLQVSHQKGLLQEEVCGGKKLQAERQWSQLYKKMWEKCRGLEAAKSNTWN